MSEEFCMAKAQPKEDVTDAELAVMEVLWEAPAAAPVRGIRERLYPGGGAAQHNTVLKLLERLEAKGFVHRDGSAMTHQFSAAVGREELIGRRLRAVADELCGGSLAPLISGLVRTAQPLKPREIQELRALIDQLDRRRARK